MSSINLNRRQFIVASLTVTGGLALGLGGGRPSAARTLTDDGFDPWLVVEPDNTVTIRVSTPEIGTGAPTQLAMTMAEELHCDWDTVNIEYASLQMDDAHDQVFTKSIPHIRIFQWPFDGH